MNSKGDELETNQVDYIISQMLKSVDEKHEKNGTWGSNEHNHDRKDVIERMKTDRDAIEKQIFETKRRAKLEEMGPRIAGKVVFYQSTGRVTYFKPSVEEIEAVFGKGTNPYRLLNYLVANPGRVCSAKELGETLRPARERAEFDNYDRRVRDTIKKIRKLLGIKGNKKDDLFDVKLGFSLKCDGEIRP